MLRETIQMLLTYDNFCLALLFYLVETAAFVPTYKLDKLGAAAYELGNTSSRTIAEVKQC